MEPNNAMLIELFFSSIQLEIINLKVETRFALTRIEDTIFQLWIANFIFASEICCCPARSINQVD